MKPRLLTQSQLWWNGPEWLAQVSSSWPDLTCWRRGHTGLPEMRYLATVVDITDEMVTHFSSYKRLVRVLAWIKRFLLNSSIREPEQWTPDSGRTKGRRNPLATAITGEVLPKEVECLQQHQPVPRSSSIAQHTPLLGADGLMRVGGRLQRTELVMDQQHPIILHHHDRLTNLIAMSLTCTSVPLD